MQDKLPVEVLKLFHYHQFQAWCSKTTGLINVQTDDTGILTSGF